MTPSLYDSAPESEYRRLVIRYSGSNWRDFASMYSDAADRLAGTFSGEPIDDLILLPYLTLSRQAAELYLKSHITDLASYRRNQGDSSPALQPDAVIEHLRGHRLGHRLDPLLAELQQHWSTIRVPLQIPEELTRFIGQFHETDSGGTGFRYPGADARDPENYEDIRVDFVALNLHIRSNLDLLSVLLDPLEDWLSAPEF